MEKLSIDAVASGYDNYLRARVEETMTSLSPSDHCTNVDCMDELREPETLKEDGLCDTCREVRMDALERAVAAFHEDDQTARVLEAVLARVKSGAKTDAFWRALMGLEAADDRRDYDCLPVRRLRG